MKNPNKLLQRELKKKGIDIDCPQFKLDYSYQEIINNVKLTKFGELSNVFANAKVNVRAGLSGEPHLLVIIFTYFWEYIDGGGNGVTINKILNL